MPASKDARVLVFSAGIALAAAFLFANLVAGRPALDAPLHVPWWVLAPAFAVAEVAVVHVQLRSQAFFSSLTELPLVVGLFFATPSELVVAYLLGALFALTLHRRQRPIKLVFNLCHFAFQAVLTVVLFRALLPGGDPIQPLGWLAALGSTLATDLVAGLTIAAVIAISEGRKRLSLDIVGVGTVATMVNTALGITIAASLWVRRDAAWLLLLPAALLYVAYRAYTDQRRKRDSLERLYSSTRALQESIGEHSVVRELLAQARQMMNAGVAEIILFPQGEDRSGLRSILGPGDVERTQSVKLDPTVGVWARVASEGHGLLLVPPVEYERVRDYLERENIRDAVVAPLFGEGGIVGTLMAGNRLGDVGTFDDPDVKMLETLAAHAGMSLEKGRLLEDLREQAGKNEFLAHHDPLTGLYNREHFRELVDAALANPGDAPMSAVMLMDLDRFKEINDTLGHQVGDRVLKELAARLRAVLPHILISRLGGDEFAFYFPSLARSEDAKRRASYVTEALKQPFMVDDIRIDVAGSIGATIHPLHGHDADVLLQRADVAMYTAKRKRTDCEVYEPGQDTYSPERLALAGELREAIEQEDLEVFYQPIIDLQGNVAVGAEALARWEHPEQGPISPAEFIPLAEHTGLIRPLTVRVLRAALSQCNRWRQLDPGFFVAVNLSPRSLDPSLNALVEGVLDEFDAPASSLHLEITESSIMEDPQNAIAVLERLTAMGISIAVDDFGTGHSSLAYLKRLPIEHLKIDRSFVMTMLEDPNDAIIVRSTVDLAKNLGLSAVAEGIEGSEEQVRLADMGCRYGQGFHISRPMPADKMSSWLVAHRSVHLQKPMSALRTEEPVHRFPAAGDR